MSLSELLPAVRSLRREEKLRLLQFLAGEIAREEGLPAIQPGDEYPIWSPYDAFDAAATLERVLEEDRGNI
jgi:hypothetical protein